MNSTAPELNGRPLALEEFEFSRSLAIAPDGRRFILGADWSLRAYSPRENDPDGEPELLWEQPVPGAVWAVNVSGDGRYAVAGYGDGTLRWHRMEDGVEVLALYPHPDGRRWVLWTPQGHYQASAGGEDLIGWHVNRGADRAADFFPVSHFRDQFYRPDVIARVLETGDPLQALRLADEDRGQTRTRSTRTRTVAELLPPTIEILSPAPDASVDSQKLILLYQSESRGGPIAGVEARIDGRPADVLEHLRPSVTDGGWQIVGQITLAIPPQDGVAELIARNEHAASAPAAFRISWGGGADAYKPSLYVLAAGVSDYPKQKVTPLRFAARDARAFTEALEGQEGGLYKADFTGNGHVTILELGAYLDDCVKRFTDGRQRPTMTLPPAVRDRPMFRVRRDH